MRGAFLALLLLVAGAILVPASDADSPARAHAHAAAVTATLGEYGGLDARGNANRDKATGVTEDGIAVGEAEMVAHSSTEGGRGTSRAAALARRVDLFDGLVTAAVARRTATAAAAGTVRSGRIAGLTIEGRAIGDVRQSRIYPLSDGGSVIVNRGTAALQVTLGAPRGDRPAGTAVRVAFADATARDAVIATPTATPSPTPTATPKPAKRRAKAKRRPAPKVPERLTGQRYAFPVYGKAAVADDFGAPRADTGAHEGNDVFAPFGAPVLAVADGVVEKVGTLPISGNRLWLRTPAGDEFFYAHLSAFSPDAEDGRRVKAGTVLGFTGNTGDAEPTPPHVHFEIHPGGKDAIDPHAILLAWQANRDVPPGAWLTRHGGDTAERPGALVEVRDFIAGE